MLRKNFPTRHAQRHEEALVRQAAYDKLSESEKLALLPSTSCARQRKRLVK